MGILESAFIFISTGTFIVAAIAVMIFSSNLKPKKKAKIWFILAFGLLIFGIYNYLQITHESRIINGLTVLGEDKAVDVITRLSAERNIARSIAGIVGSVSILYGMVTIFYDIRNGEVSFTSKKFAEKRKKKIWKIIENITDRYNKGEIDDRELTNIRADLVRELAEIESESKNG